MSQPPQWLEPGDNLLVDGKTLLSWVIKKVTGSKYSHIAVVSSKLDPKGNPMAVEAIGRGVTYTLLRKFDWSRVKVRRFRPEHMTSGQLATYLAEVESYVGRYKYDWPLLLKLLVWLALDLRRKRPLPIEHRERICSLVSSIPFSHATATDIIDGLPATNTVPADFERSTKLKTMWTGFGLAQKWA
jgi:hypothetical protein